MNDKNEKTYLTTTPIRKLLLKFAVPCVLSMLVSALYNIVDQIFIGNSIAGVAGIMATTLVYPLTVIALALALLIGDGCATLFSISLGAKDEKTSNKSVGNAIISVIVASIILVILGFIFMNPFLNLLGIDGYSNMCQEFTKQYYRIILIGLPFFMFSVASSSIIRASGSPTYSMISTIIGAIINLILDPILIFKFNMGVQGAAVATITGQVVSAIMCLLYFKKPKLMKLNKDCFKIDFSVISKLAKLGISSFITQISVAIITIVANNIVGIIGGVNATDAGGALGIVFKIFGIVIAFSIGFSVGGQPIIGFNYGAKEYKRVLETYKQIILANVIIGLVSLILFQFFPEYIVKIFGGQANDIDFYQNYAILCFKIYLGGILFCCIQKASCIFLQSIDRPYKAMLLSLTRDVILLVPAVCLLGLFGNLYTMLYAGIIADVGAFILTIVFVAIEYKNISKLSEEKVEVKEFSNNKRFVISIGREYGSGGKYIGEMLAKRLNIKCYDNEILKEVASDYNIDIDTLEKVDEKQKSSFWYGFANNYFFSEDGKISPISAEDNLFLKQARVIEKLYEKEDCVIIGRCSDYILKNKQNVISIFVYSSDMDFKIARKQEFEKLSKDKAKKKILKIDKERSNYYNHFTSQIWGDKNNYDILVDSSKLGVDKTVDILENYIKEKLK